MVLSAPVTSFTLLSAGPFFLSSPPYFNVSFSSILTFTKPTNVKGNTSKEENAHLRLFLDVLKIVPF